MNPQQISTSFLIATGHIRAMRGGAQSHMLTANDGNAYVIKFANNPQSPRSPIYIAGGSHADVGSWPT